MCGNPSILVAVQGKMETRIFAICVLALETASQNFLWMIIGMSSNSNMGILSPPPPPCHSIFFLYSKLFFRCDDCKECDRERCYHWVLVMKSQ